MGAGGLGGALRRWGPPVAWMGVIALFSEPQWDAATTRALLRPVFETLFPWAAPATLEGLHVALRKLGHLVEYAVLALLWVRALEPGRAAGQARRLAFLLALAYATVDELHQGWTGARTASAWDVALDAAGAGLALGSLAGGERAARRLRQTARVVATLTALGALLGVALDWSLGLPALDLLIAALLAGAGAALLGPARPRPRDPG